MRKSAMLLGTNIEHAKSLNRRVVLEAVRRSGSMTRADLARLTGLTAQAVSNISLELVEAGLVLEGARRRGQRGQPATEISLNPEGGFAVGLSLGHQALSGVLVNLAGTVLATESHDVAKRVLPLDRLTDEMETLVQELLARAGLARGQLWGVGCGLPGLVRDGVLSVETSSTAERLHYPLAETLGRRLDLPVFAENDARAAAIGERLYGIGRQAQHFFYIHFGFGIGGGPIIAGEQYRGGSGGAGEIGHMIVKPGGRPCNCGNRGCLEQYVSLYAAAEAISGADRSPEDVPVRELAQRMERKDPLLLGWIRDAAPYLRLAIHNIEIMFDPETVVLGGSLPETVRNALIAETEPLLPAVYPDSRPRLPRLVRAEAQDMPALGAAALPISAMLQPSRDLLWKGRGAGGQALNLVQTVLGAPLGGQAGSL
ncbi:MAG TPA: ROK family transcriptional regulator [Acidisoma sp.]|uniref:ROK family transcriptional regulator n=1 Tax=Acidisoma sp. TaxID=1872115 RepID=UPI002C24B4AC|nr:ROK family transcriptional regulator [Acidisoma sp.]HTI01593.1 ROK family transcriptional regulator [Acidisoma sp.]